MSWWSKLRNTLRPERLESEIDEELRFHLDQRQEDFGKRPARLRFGNPSAIAERTRGETMLTGLESLLADMRYAWRQLRASPVLTLTVVATLAIGMGANLAIFSLMDAALLRALPVDDPKSLTLLWWRSEAGWPKLCESHQGGTIGGQAGRLEGSSFSPRLYRALAAKQTAFTALIGFSDHEAEMVAAGDQTPQRTTSQYVSPNYFATLGIRPVLGGGFGESDDRVGAEPVVAVSHNFWRTRLKGDPAVIGRNIRVSNVSARVVAVLPPGFFGTQIGDIVEIYLPLAARSVIKAEAGKPLAERDNYWWVRMMARLRPDAAASASTDQLTALYRRLVVPEGVTVDGKRIPVLAARDGRHGFDHLGSQEDVWAPMLAIHGMVGLLLLLVCANVANLLLARAVHRQREFGVRLALGASRWRVIRQQLVECLVLAALGAAGGLALGYAGARGLLFLLVDNNGPVGGLDLNVDERTLVYLVSMTVITAVLFGLAPAFRAGGSKVSGLLKSQARGVLAGRLRLPRVLVTVQVAMGLALVMAAALLGRSLLNLKLSPVGLARDQLVYVTLAPKQAGYGESQVAQYIGRLSSELAAVPGVTGVANVGWRPLSGSSSASLISFRGEPENKGNPAYVNEVSPNFFDVAGIPMLQGRPLIAADEKATPRPVVVDTQFVQSHLSGNARKTEPPASVTGGDARSPGRVSALNRRQAIGSIFRLGDTDHAIVGVVERAGLQSLKPRPGSPQGAVYELYVPGNTRYRDVHFALRTRLDSAALGAAVRAKAAAVDRAVPVLTIESQETLIDRILVVERLLATTAGAFGTIALVIAAVGLAGLIAYAVARRTNEIGIRMALGARPGDVRAMVLREALLLAAAGVALGVPLAYGVGRLIESQLFGLKGTDASTFAAAIAALALAAAAAAWLPARRASRIEPMAALRDE